MDWFNGESIYTSKCGYLHPDVQAASKVYHHHHQQQHHQHQFWNYYKLWVGFTGFKHEEGAFMCFPPSGIATSNPLQLAIPVICNITC
jgi:hypothetical protein